MKNYGQTNSTKDIQTRQSVEETMAENGTFFSIESTGTVLRKNIPSGSLILITSTQQVLTSTSELVSGKSIAEQSDKVLVAGGITWESFN